MNKRGWRKKFPMNLYFLCDCPFGVGVGVCAGDHYDNQSNTVKPTPIP